MRYIIFSALYAPSIGGVENFTAHVASELAAMGHDVTIVTSNIANLPSTEERGPLTIVRLPCRNLLNGRLPIPRTNPEARLLWDKLDAMPCDGILVNTRFYPHSLLGARYARRKGITPVVLDHGSAYLTLGNPLIDTAIKVYEHGITSLIKRTRPHYCGVSQKSCEWLRTFGIDTQDIIPNAIDAAEFRAGASQRDFRHEFNVPDDKLLAVLVGRLVPEKGVAQLVEAGRLLHEQGSPCSILIAGDGPLRDELERTATPNVTFVGPLDKPDVAQVLLQADVMCLPSRSEGFGAVLLEAAACGTPSISTQVGVAPDLIQNEEYGTLLADASPSSISEALNRYAFDRKAARDHGRNVQRFVERRYTWHATAAVIEQIFAACTQ